MYIVESSKRYDKALKKLQSQKSFSENQLNTVIDVLASGQELPLKYKDHQLKGELVGFRECHVKDDLLLVYYKDKKVLVLVLINIGTHHQLFGN